MEWLISNYIMWNYSSPSGWTKQLSMVGGQRPVPAGELLQGRASAQPPLWGDSGQTPRPVECRSCGSGRRGTSRCCSDYTAPSQWPKSLWLRPGLHFGLLMCKTLKRKRQHNTWEGLGVWIFWYLKIRFNFDSLVQNSIQQSILDSEHLGANFTALRKVVWQIME